MAFFAQRVGHLAAGLSWIHKSALHMCCAANGFDHCCVRTTGAALATSLFFFMGVILSIDFEILKPIEMTISKLLDFQSRTVFTLRGELIFVHNE